MTGPRIGSLFSGYGGLELGIQDVLGGSVAWHVENDRAPSRVLAHHWPDVPNFGDITSVDWARVAPVDVLCGGFPCQDVSVAGFRRGLNAHSRSGLWAHFAVAIDALRPPLVVIENVKGLLSAKADRNLAAGAAPVDGTSLRAIGAILGDLADIGYNAEWRGVSAADAGAPHLRRRIFITAHPAADARSDEPERRGGPGALDGAAEVPPDARHPQHDAAGPGRGTAGRGRPHGTGGAGQEGGAPTADPGGEAGRGRAGLREGGPEGFGWGRPADSAGENGWGPYSAAIRRWEQVTGRPAPAPTESGAKGGHRLAPDFVEWLMGLPDGWVTAVPLQDPLDMLADLLPDVRPATTRNEQLRMLGNGVVPQQAALALRQLLPHMPPPPPPVDWSQGIRGYDDPALELF